VTFKIEDGVPKINDREFRWAAMVRIEDNEFGGSMAMHNRGFHLQFESGYKLSIQWGSFSYCQGYPWYGLTETDGWQPESPDAEIALWDDKGNWYEWPGGDQVQGFCSPEFVLAIIDFLSNPHGIETKQGLKELADAR
jgi:hypothetical protein